MGGYGSGRWNWRVKKTQAEECHKLTIYFFKEYLFSGNSGIVRWSRGGQEVAKIGYSVMGVDKPNSLCLSYKIRARSGHSEDFDYPVNLTTTFLPWGGERYWFECPLQGCGRRVGCLYLPPGGKYFGCRHCYNLSYESRQEGHATRNFLSGLAATMQDSYPGLDWKDMRAILEDKTTPHLKQLAIERYLREWQEYDPYIGYLTADELCQLSGLAPDDLFRLEAARLLLPDTKDGRYRPKLASWGGKLAYLLGEGWGVEEIKAWTTDRWKTNNPRQWPPARTY